jgi:hypothetical protein
VAFGRRSKAIEVEYDEPTEEDVDNFVDDLDPEQRAAEDAELLAEMGADEPAVPAFVVLDRPEGPWDVEDAPATDPERLDLGSLKVPVVPDVEVRLEVSPEGDVVAATLVVGETSLQLNAFAAPRKEGIWGEVRAEILGALTEGGGQAKETDGPFGVELRAGVPTEVPGQGVLLAPARFLGVDGPRWFLRGLVTGPGAVEDHLAQPLLEAFRLVAVDRGGEAMAVRDPLPLQLPPDAIQTDEHGVPTEDPLRLAERGPEITEIR